MAPTKAHVDCGSGSEIYAVNARTTGYDPITWLLKATFYQLNFFCPLELLSFERVPKGI
jgi:hypothetical protein